MRLFIAGFLVGSALVASSAAYEITDGQLSDIVAYAVHKGRVFDSYPVYARLRPNEATDTCHHFRSEYSYKDKAEMSSLPSVVIERVVFHLEVNRSIAFDRHDFDCIPIWFDD